MRANARAGKWVESGSGDQGPANMEGKRDAVRALGQWEH